MNGLENGYYRANAKVISELMISGNRTCLYSRKPYIDFEHERNGKST